MKDQASLYGDKSEPEIIACIFVCIVNNLDNLLAHSMQAC